ncbi:hypothetical protein [Deinococcus sp. JMULE3]|uniref:hypothetical protein n=1 Tax=Deinococcus sp. JMULE3 TaxID=2518341 RepID=UPI001575944E|nr:hypothetical protein [Deinococcus sp. JMULE3]NTY00593.1 hypothetical protein [Deinococcus sp. JMULE3]
MQLHPYLGFDGQAREALEFYRSCLGGTLDLMTIADSPVAAHFPPTSRTASCTAASPAAP